MARTLRMARLKDPEGWELRRAMATAQFRTIGALAEKSGISRGPIDALFRGASVARGTALQIAEALGVEADVLFVDVNDEKAVA